MTKTTAAKALKQKTKSKREIGVYLRKSKVHNSLFAVERTSCFFAGPEY